MNATTTTMLTAEQVREKRTRLAVLEKKAATYSALATVSAREYAFPNGIPQELWLESEAEGPSTRQEIARLQLELLEHDRETVKQREKEREAIHAAYAVKKRAAIVTLKTTLLAAVKANDVLKALQLAEHEQTGDSFEALSWLELSRGDGTRFDNWLKAIKTYGLDTE